MNLKVGESMMPIATDGWPIKTLLSDLQGKYSKKGLQDKWKEENEQLESRLRHLSNTLSKQYVSPKIINVGGAGVVLRLVNTSLGDTPVALKFPRPIAAHEDLLSALLDREIKHLITARHPGIVRIHHKGTAIQSVKPLKPFVFLIMDFIDGTSADEFLQTETITETELLDILVGSAEALMHLHEHDTVHFDIKAENILITGDKRPVVADLGTAKRLGADDDTSTTIVACTPRFAHKKVHEWLKDTGDNNRWEATVERRHLRREFDLPPFGFMVLEFLGYSDSGETLKRSSTIRQYTKKYLLLVAARAMCGAVPRWLESKLGLSQQLLESVAYSDLKEVLYDLYKLTGKTSFISVVPELNNYHPNTIQIASDSPTTHTERLGHTIANPFLKRLASISQLGMVALVYPTATHSRLEHSLGTYHNACHFVRALDNDPLCPVFRQLMRPVDVVTVLVAALFHDLGQFPLAHDLEDIDGNLFDHKRLTLAIVQGAVNGVAPLTDIMEQWGVSAEGVQKVLNARPGDAAFSVRERILHGIIDGPVDADKLDYLSRDTSRLRVPYGNGLDVDRILRSLTVIVTRQGGDGAIISIGVHEKAKVAAELVAVSRAAMFAQAYWHHAVRSAKAMLARAVQRISASLSATGTRTEWRDAFEDFVLRLPQNLYGAEVQLDPRLEADGALAPTDVAVLAQLLRELGKVSPSEIALLEGLIERRLFKRLFVFSKERGNEDWELFAQRWSGATIKQKLAIYEGLETWLETRVANRIRAGLDGTTTAITVFETLQAQLRSRTPIILIDVPSARPGADVALHYVIEGQRRSLRKDERAIGHAAESSVWREFGMGLREKAGKVRVFCHPTYIDAVEATIDSAAFVAESKRLLVANAL